MEVVLLLMMALLLGMGAVEVAEVRCFERWGVLNRALPRLMLLEEVLLKLELELELRQGPRRF